MWPNFPNLENGQRSKGTNMSKLKFVSKHLCIDRSQTLKIDPSTFILREPPWVYTHVMETLQCTISVAASVTIEIYFFFKF